MAKSVIKKSAPIPASTERKSRVRQTVLIKITAAKLHELVGDVEIGVSRKELNAHVVKNAGAVALAKVGL